MPRHSPDDFSFLPTVDSADEKDAVKDELWGKKPGAAPAHEAPREKPYADEPSPPTAPDEFQSDAPSPEPPQIIAPPAPLTPAEAASSSGESQDGRALWQAFADSEGIDVPTIIAPVARAAARPEPEPEAPIYIQPPSTPRISLGGGSRSDSTPLSQERATVAKERPREDAEVDGPADNVRSVEEPEAIPADNSVEIKQARKRALIATIGLHAAVALVMLLMHVPMLNFTPPEIVATSSVDELENESWKKVTTEMPQTSPMAASVSPMLSTGVSDIAMPAVDFAATASELNLGTSFGSFGSGVTTGGAGGKISFLGNTATAKHVVFVVDMSFSMDTGLGAGGITRITLLKRELNKSLSLLASGTAYQVIFFSTFAWPHDVVDSNDEAALSKYEWNISSTSLNVTIPRFSYIAVNSANINKSKKIIEGAATPGYTNWGSGLLMALKGNPKPDVIFFMTDGDKTDEQGWVDVVTNENSRGKRTIIHTTALGNPGAARELDLLARRNGGKFTAVMASGKILQAKDLIP